MTNGKKNKETNAKAPQWDTTANKKHKRTTNRHTTVSADLNKERDLRRQKKWDKSQRFKSTKTRERRKTEEATKKKKTHNITWRRQTKTQYNNNKLTTRRPQSNKWQKLPHSCKKNPPKKQNLQTQLCVPPLSQTPPCSLSLSFGSGRSPNKGPPYFMRLNHVVINLLHCAPGHS